jgi:hypothetical protein
MADPNLAKAQVTAGDFLRAMSKAHEFVGAPGADEFLSDPTTMRQALTRR